MSPTVGEFSCLNQHNRDSSLTDIPTGQPNQDNTSLSTHFLMVLYCIKLIINTDHHSLSIHVLTLTHATDFFSLPKHTIISPENIVFRSNSYASNYLLLSNHLINSSNSTLNVTPI